MAQPLQIRKYQNRRLYDTERSIHITQEDLLKIIQEGRDVVITDAATGEDVTVIALFQVLLAISQETLKFLPRELPLFLIRANNSMGNQLFRMIATQMGAVANPAGAFFNQFSPFGMAGFTPPPFASSTTDPGGHPPSEELLRRISEMERKMERMSRGEKGGKKNTPKKGGKRGNQGTER